LDEDGAIQSFFAGAGDEQAAVDQVPLGENLLRNAVKADRIGKLFKLTPKAIERQLKLRQPMFVETAAYGHMGRKNEVVEKTFTSRYHETLTIPVELFTWEKLDKVDEIRKAFFGK
jgi:S-adenosylmethionine synthetase